MSMLGVCADVYLGEHDDAHIQTLTSAEIESKENFAIWKKRSASAKK